jgi:hypothetical protein
LLDYLAAVRAVSRLSHGGVEGGRWWVKLSIDFDHSLAWNVVQELGHVLDCISVGERLPTSSSQCHRRRCRLPEIARGREPERAPGV